MFHLLSPKLPELQCHHPAWQTKLQRQPFGHIKAMRLLRAPQVVKKEKPPQKRGLSGRRDWGVGDGGGLAGAFSTRDLAVGSGSAGLDHALDLKRKNG